jgi:hypothetical protein
MGDLNLELRFKFFFSYSVFAKNKSHFYGYDLSYQIRSEDCIQKNQMDQLLRFLDF